MKTWPAASESRLKEVFKKLRSLITPLSQPEHTSYTQILQSYQNHKYSYVGKFSPEMLAHPWEMPLIPLPKFMEALSMWA